MSASGWMAVDFDGTLAHYDGWKGSDHLGAPVEPMVNRVKAWLADDVEVRIFTARANDPASVSIIREWCKQHIGTELAVTNAKDFGTIEIWDDRAVRVGLNTGERCL